MTALGRDSRGLEPAGPAPTTSTVRGEAAAGGRSPSRHSRPAEALPRHEIQ